MARFLWRSPPSKPSPSLNDVLITGVLAPVATAAMLGAAMLLVQLSNSSAVTASKLDMLSSQLDSLSAKSDERWELLLQEMETSSRSRH